MDTVPESDGLSGKISKNMHRMIVPKLEDAQNISGLLDIAGRRLLRFHRA